MMKTLVIVSLCTVFVAVAAISEADLTDSGCAADMDDAEFAEKDKVCQDCFSLFNEDVMRTLCRSHCFTSTYYDGCKEALVTPNESVEEEGSDSEEL